MYLFLCRDAKVVMDPLRRRIRCHRSCSVKERRSSLFSLLAEKVIIYSLRTKQTDLHYDSYPFRTSSCHAPEPTPKETTTPPPVDPTRTVVPLITVSPERNLLREAPRLVSEFPNLTFVLCFSFGLNSFRLQQQWLLLLLQ